ncbi:hypothetical protein [Pseudomonas sp. RIT288]|uniref:hypothetical protein n=1 Tax=Pseudomonas sp. RIT288 TaxID=1470589 RepID=UPI00044F6F87|nr:hypothetical protein [Pseudomonas sp. RIT288]EZP33264.1 hypothetical protein BW33_01164 [Pseudomonas sp. RIT288]
MVDRKLKKGIKPVPDERSLIIAEPAANTIPKVCLVDMDSDVLSLLKQKRYDCTIATLGGEVETPKNRPGMQSFLRPQVQLPSNLHEFHVVVVDLAMNEVVDEVEARADLKNTSGKKAYALVSSYPEQVFNSKGFGAQRFSHEIREVLERESVVVIFAAENHNVHYDLAEIGMHGTNIVQQLDCDTLRLCDGIKNFKNKFGRTVQLYKENTRFHSLLGKYLDGAMYEVFFYPHTVFKNGKSEPDENFVPLLTNAAGEVVGYAVFVNKGAVFVLPQITKKPDFLVELFDELAAIFPEVLPYNGMFGWLDDGSCSLPGEEDIRKERAEIEAKFVADIAENEAALDGLRKELNFLRVMLSGTGDELVVAVRDYLIWLGYSSAKTMDEHSEDVLEEDIQVELEPGLLVIEVKGIGGTSKDKECAQISKIKNRRQEERKAWDVTALYIVNHQRYVSPKLRTNPPFTENQIKDAQLDKRGLITTYQLYNAYLDIVRGLVTKGDVRKQLLEIGHVKITPPELIEIGIVKEVFQQGRIAILQLGEATVSLGTKLYVLKNDAYEVREIIGLKLNDLDMNECTGGEVGIQLDAAIRKGSQIYMSAFAI